MLKRLISIGLVLGVGAFLFANELQPLREQTLPNSGVCILQRTPPSYTFTKLPTDIINSYYDYMVGSYNNLPLRVIPQSQGGGYFMTYTGRRQATSQRRVFYTYLDAQCNIINNNEISSVANFEGFSTLAVDPVSGKPLYAWQANADADPQLEVQLTSDAFIAGIGGLFNDIQIAIDNPLTITTSGGVTTTNNEFLWPSAVIGPSPIANKRRVYVIGRNSTLPTANIYLAYDDFNADDIEMGVPFVWTYSSIPELNNWAVDTAVIRRPSLALAADGMGNVFLAGYHTAQTPSGEPIVEDDIDIFRCTNYGMGNWTRYSASSALPSWNPHSEPNGSTGYFVNEADVPYTNGELNWKILNSEHLNATVANYQQLHILGIWGLSTPDSYYPELQYVKEVVYDIQTNDIEIREVFPQNPSDNTYSDWFQPWDNEDPWGEVDAYDGNATEGFVPRMNQIWPFPHWDASAHDGTMMYNYNNLKVTEANDQGMMAAVWQGCYRARQFNEFNNSDYSAYVNTPEIYISISPNNGSYWYEPIILNNVNTPQLAALKPMWVYPADKVVYTGMQGYNRVGNLGLMFYNDNTWGSNSLTPAYHPDNNGGSMMFMELEIVFDNYPDDDDVVADPIFSPPAGTYTAPCTVSLSTATQNATIYYTLDSSVPTQSSILYTTPFQLTTSTTTRARAYKTGWDASNIVNSYYIIPQLLVGTTTFSPPTGIYYTETDVSLFCATAGAHIRYTLDGSIPTETSTLYQMPIHLPLQSNTVIVARGFKSNYTPGPVCSAGYTVTGTVQSLDIEPPAGVYEDPIQVTISCSTPESAIHYTLDGTEPNLTSPLYTEPIPIGQTTTLKAMAYRMNWAPSPLTTMEYQIGLSNQDDVISVTGIQSAYPNPFSADLNIEIGIKEASKDFNLSIYNIKGECVHKHNGVAQGLFLYSWNGTDANGKRLPAGIYLLRLETDDKLSQQKIVLK